MMKSLLSTSQDGDLKVWCDIRVYFMLKSLIMYTLSFYSSLQILGRARS